MHHIGSQSLNLPLICEGGWCGNPHEQYNYVQSCVRNFPLVGEGVRTPAAHIIPNFRYAAILPVLRRLGDAYEF